MVQTERRPSQVVTFGSPFGYHQTFVTNIPTRKRSIPTQSSVISAKKCSVVYRVPIQLEWQPQKVCYYKTIQIGCVFLLLTEKHCRKCILSKLKLLPKTRVEMDLQGKTFLFFAIARCQVLVG